MMNESKKEIWAVVFLFVAIVIFFAGLAWIKDIFIQARSYKVKVYFDDVTGLQVGNKVEIAGVREGQVSQIRLINNKALVLLDINKDIVIPIDSRIALITNSLLTGEKSVRIYPGNAKEFIRGKDTILEGYFENPLPIAELTQSLRELQRLLSEVDLDSINELFIFRMDQMFNGINRILFPLKIAANNLDSTINNLDVVVGKIDNIIDDIDKGRGTVGQLINNDSIVYELRETNDSIKSLIEDIKKHPQKYIKVRVRVF